MDGLDCLGAEQAGDFSDLLKKQGVSLMAETAKELGKDGKKPDAKKDDKKTDRKGGSWLTDPVLGPVPGWGVAAGGAGVLGTVLYFLFR